MKTRRIVLICLISALLLTQCVSLIGYYVNNLCIEPYCHYASLVISLVALACITYGIDFALCLNLGKKSKKACPFTNKKDCPYTGISDCPYDTTHCHSFAKPNKRNIRLFILWLLFLITIVTYVLATLIISENNFISNICISLISAMLVAFLIDMPGRMKEYRGYFVELMSSNDYLKHLDDAELSKLRKQITWVQHAKDYPNMPRELIGLDEKLCNMLKEPYFEEFTQIVDLTKEGNKITKRCSVEYTIQNPSKNKKSTSVDVGLSISVMLPKECIDNIDTLKDEAREVLKIRKFLAFDDQNNAYDLKPHIRTLVYTSVMDNSDYNAEIHIAPLEEFSNQSKPLLLKNLQKETCNTTDIPIEKSNTDNIDFCIEFEKNMIIKLEYDVVVPDKDKCFSKRLRYPVKYFKVDYTLGKGFEATELSGQLIGTLIDQKNISFYQSDDKKHLSFWTHSWLLPKNGVFIVHSN